MGLLAPPAEMKAPPLPVQKQRLSSAPELEGSWFVLCQFESKGRARLFWVHKKRSVQISRLFLLFSLSFCTLQHTANGRGSACPSCLQHQNSVPALLI